MMIDEIRAKVEFHRAELARYEALVAQVESATLPEGFQVVRLDSADGPSSKYTDDMPDFESEAWYIVVPDELVADFMEVRVDHRGIVMERGTRVFRITSWYPTMLEAMLGHLEDPGYWDE